jgi:predicted nucleic-acid-binding protein
MLGLDSNILLRHLLQDDAVQSPLATRLIRSRCSSEEPGFVSLIVLVEMLWTLRRGYAFGREALETAVSDLLESEELLIESEELISEALDIAKRNKLDIPDILISLVNRAHGCSETMSFDKDLVRSRLASPPV